MVEYRDLHNAQLIMHEDDNMWSTGAPLFHMIRLV